MDYKLDLSEFFVTKKQANDFVQCLSSIIDQLFEVNFNLENALTNEFGIDKKDKFMNLLRDLKMNNTTNEELKKLLINIQDEIRNLPVVNLTVAFEPNEASLKAFIEWFLFTLKKQILLDIQVDKKIIAGAKINYNGKFKDYSVKPFFDELIDEKINQKFATNTQSINQKENIQV